MSLDHCLDNFRLLDRKLRAGSGQVSCESSLVTVCGCELSTLRMQKYVFAGEQDIVIGTPPALASCLQVHVLYRKAPLCSCETTVSRDLLLLDKLCW